jgi:eukaryotic-like serine/threonine-protein kinase
MSLDTTTRDGPKLEGHIVAGKFRVLRIIGSGGMGTVWEGVHVKLGTRVAIKFIRPQFAQQPEARARFEIEARAAAKLQTKHACHVYDYGVSDEGLPYIVMEYLDGESLSEVILRRGMLPAIEVANIIGQAARALDKAHQNGVVHRDLKPDNIFLATAEEGVTQGQFPYTVKLVDFGIAKILDDVHVEGSGNPMGGPTREGTVIGTPNFMAPEQLTVGGAPGPLTDVWSLGACAFAAMTARIPFEGDVLGDIVLKVCAAPMPIASRINPNVPVGFDAWFSRACARSVEKRFQTATELADALAAVCGLSSVRIATLDEDQVQYVLRARSMPDIQLADDIPDPKAMSPKTALLAGLVLGVALMVGLAGFLAWRDQARDDSGTFVLPPSAPPPASSAPEVVSAPPSASAAPSASGTKTDAGAKGHPRG